MPQMNAEQEVAAVRAFNRFYTRKLGIIEPKLLHSPFTLQEARIMYEIVHRPACTASDLTRDLGLEPHPAGTAAPPDRDPKAFKG